MVEANSKKPLVFIASSTQGLDVAKAIRSQLVTDCKVKIWNEAFAELSFTIMDSLLNSIGGYDFAVVIMTADDVVVSKNVEKLAPRDNLLFEAGLFIGRLGRERTFIVTPTMTTIKIPSDLAGITMATYEVPEDPSELPSAVGPACDMIIGAMRNSGRTRQLKQLEEQLKQQQLTINELVNFSMSSTIFEHLCGIALLYDYKYWDKEENRREFYFLRDNGLIKPRRKDISFLDFNSHWNGANVADLAEPTPAGWYRIRLRKNEIPYHNYTAENIRISREELEKEPAQGAVG